MVVNSFTIVHVEVVALVKLTGLAIVKFYFTIDDNLITYLDITLCEINATKSFATVHFELCTSLAVIGDVVGGIAVCASIGIRLIDFVNLRDDTLRVDVVGSS